MNKFRFLIIVLFVLSCSVGAQAQGTPNLRPYQPSGWSDKIVVSTQTGTNTDSNPLRTTDTLYLDWAVANDGTASVGISFQIALYIDGLQKQTWTVSPPMDANTYIYVPDYPLGSLNAGIHTIRLLADSANVVMESNELDNEYSKVITVIAPPNLTPYHPNYAHNGRDRVKKEGEG